MSEPFGVPDACTLPTVEQPLRLTEIDQMLTASVRSVQRLSPTRLRLVLDPDAAVAARMADLLVREAQCCSFFTFTMTMTSGSLTLEIAVPPAHADVLDALAGRPLGS